MAKKVNHLHTPNNIVTVRTMLEACGQQALMTCKFTQFQIYILKIHFNMFYANDLLGWHKTWMGCYDWTKKNNKVIFYVYAFLSVTIHVLCQQNPRYSTSGLAFWDACLRKKTTDGMHLRSVLHLCSLAAIVGQSLQYARADQMGQKIFHINQNMESGFDPG